MLRYSIVAAVVLSCTPASAATTETKKAPKLGTGCIGPVSMVVPKVGTCTIAGGQIRIWCPNGQMFERVQDQPHQSLLRSLCNMLQVP